MAIEDIIQIKDTVSQDGIIPFDKNQDVMSAQNQVEFLRTQKDMGLSEDAVIAKLIQMFVEEPTKFTKEFGKESAEAIRGFLGFKKQEDMEKEGYVFDENSSEIIGQNISDLAIGTLPTEQSEKFNIDESLKERLYLQNKQDSMNLPKILSAEQERAMNLATAEQERRLTQEEAKVDDQTIKQERRLTQEEVKEYGFPYTDGQIYILNTETGNIRRKEPQGIEKIILDIMDWFKYGRQDPENRDYE